MWRTQIELHDRERCKAPWILGDRIETAVINAVRAVLKAGVLEEKIAKYGPKLQVVDYQAELVKAERDPDLARHGGTCKPLYCGARTR